MFSVLASFISLVPTLKAEPRPMSCRSCGEMVDTVYGADCLSLGLGLSFCGKGGFETVGGSSGWGGLGQD